MEEFENVLKEFGNNEIFILNMIENDTILFYEFFTMAKTKPSYLAVVLHPLLTNAYYKDLPDKIIDSFVDNSNNIYRYLFVNYGKQMNEYIVEFPINIKSEIYNFLF